MHMRAITQVRMDVNGTCLQIRNVHHMSSMPSMAFLNRSLIVMIIHDNNMDVAMQAQIRAMGEDYQWSCSDRGQHCSCDLSCGQTKVCGHSHSFLFWWSELFPGETIPYIMI